MWNKIKKQTESVPNYDMAVTFRNTKVIKFNKQVALNLDIHLGDYVEIFYDDETNRVGFKFSKERVSDDCYTVSKDGGGNTDKVSSYAGFIVQASQVYKDIPRIAEVSNLDKSSKKYTPEIKDGMLIVDLIPVFESIDLGSAKNGIYKLVKDGKVVYIGKGDIRSRVKAHSVNGKEFDSIQYSSIDNDDECFKWEKYYLDLYKDKFGTLPLYNKINGRGTKDVC